MSRTSSSPRSKTDGTRPAQTPLASHRSRSTLTCMMHLRRDCRSAGKTAEAERPQPLRVERVTGEVGAERVHVCRRDQSLHEDHREGLGVDVVAELVLADTCL